MFSIPEPNPYWLIAIYATAILVALLGLAAFLLVVDAVIARVFGAIHLRVRWPKRRRELPNVELVDPALHAELREDWDTFRPTAKVLPMRESRTVKAEVIW